MEALGELGAVPHQELSAGGNWPHRVEVDLHAVLARSQVLLAGRVGWVDVAHPVGLLLRQAVHKVVELTLGVDLMNGGRKRGEEKVSTSDVLVSDRVSKFEKGDILIRRDLKMSPEKNQETVRQIFPRLFC